MAPTYDAFNRTCYRISRWILGGVFIYASLDKILHPDAFAQAIYNYQILPDALINISALILPWLELILGILLIAGRLMPGTVVITNLLLILFIGALSFNVYRGLDVSCGCFSTGPDEKAAGLMTILRDGNFLIFSGFMFWYTFLRPSGSSGKSV